MFPEHSFLVRRNEYGQRAFQSSSLNLLD